MKLSIIIPVYNEEKTIEEVIRKVINLPLGLEKELIVISDGSTDRTNQILRGLKEELGFILLIHEKNQGKGAALRTGIDAVSGEAVIVQDADLEYNPENWEEMFREFDQNSAVYGSRNINPQRKGYSRYVFGAWLLTAINNLLFSSKLTDTYTCYKLLPAKLLRSLDLKSDGFEIEAEMTAKLLKEGVPIKEVPIEYYPRKFNQGKKIRFKDGIIGLWTILRCRF
ncbi:MAG: glycosyltransferase family 2 protein [Candidatus Portnoybacteria bacterium]